MEIGVPGSVWAPDLDLSLCLVISHHGAASLPPVSVPHPCPVCVTTACSPPASLPPGPHSYQASLGEPLPLLGGLCPRLGVRRAGLASFCPCDCSSLAVVGREPEGLRSHLRGPSAGSLRPGAVSYGLLGKCHSEMRAGDTEPIYGLCALWRRVIFYPQQMCLRAPSLPWRPRLSHYPSREGLVVPSLPQAGPWDSRDPQHSCFQMVRDRLVPLCPHQAP